MQHIEHHLTELGHTIPDTPDVAQATALFGNLPAGFILRAGTRRGRARRTEQLVWATYARALTKK